MKKNVSFRNESKKSSKNGSVTSRIKDSIAGLMGNKDLLTAKKNFMEKKKVSLLPTKAV